MFSNALPDTHADTIVALLQKLLDTVTSVDDVTQNSSNHPLLAGSVHTASLLLSSTVHLIFYGNQTPKDVSDQSVPRHPFAFLQQLYLLCNKCVCRLLHCTYFNSFAFLFLPFVFRIGSWMGLTQQIATVLQQGGIVKPQLDN